MKKQPENTGGHKGLWKRESSGSDGTLKGIGNGFLEVTAWMTFKRFIEMFQVEAGQKRRGDSHELYKHCWLGVGIVSAVDFMGHPYRQGGEVGHWTLFCQVIGHSWGKITFDLPT